MALTIVVQPDEGNVSLGPIPTSLVAITGDTSYPTGGYTAALGLTAANLNCGRGINAMLLGGWNSAAEGYLAVYNTQTGNLQVFVSGGQTGGTVGGNVVITAGTLGEAIGVNPVSNSGALSAASGNNLTIPISTFLGGNLSVTGNGSAAGAFVELANGTNVSTFTWTFFVIGQR